MNRRRTLKVFIAGIETPAMEVHTTHDVDQPIGTGSITLRAPRPSYVELGATVTVYAGYDGVTHPIFSGRIADDNASFGGSGSDLRVEMEGWGKLLWYAQQADMSIAGSETLQKIFIALCTERGVPYFFGDYTSYPDGQPVQFGGRPEVDNANIIIPKDSSPGEMIDRFARLYGYRAYDRPDGMHRLKKISGLPVGSVVRAYTEGVNVLSVSQGRTIDTMANYIEVLGARYTAADTSEVAIRSIPATVPFDSRLGPSGVNRVRISDPAIVTTVRADHARNVHEIDRSTPHHRWSWTGTGDPEMLPGQVVSVTSPTVGSNTAMWLMRVAHSITDSGWTTTMEGWSGAGTAFPAGNDCVTQTLVNTTGFHIGNEYLSHYRTPNPAGLVKEVTFSVADAYSTLTIRGYAHGANSFVGNQQSTASKFEIWQTVDAVYKSVASGEMPRQDEKLEQRLDYDLDANWDPIVIPLSGSLNAGSATLKIISGYDNTVGDYDDFECRDITLTTCGVGEPVIVV